MFKDNIFTIVNSRHRNVNFPVYPQMGIIRKILDFYRKRKKTFSLHISSYYLKMQLFPVDDFIQSGKILGRGNVLPHRFTNTSFLDETESKLLGLKKGVSSNQLGKC